MDSAQLPDAVAERWQRAWGEEVVAAAGRLILRRPPLDLTFVREDAASSFAQANSGRSLAPGNVRLESSSVTDLPGFGDGGWWVQDLAASMPARLVPAGSQDVLDLCAAPGGKTMQLAAAGHQVVAVDSSESRLARLRENLARTHLQAELVTADALKWQPKRSFDAILLDAPCAATGTFRRHPEVLYRARPPVIADNSGLQDQLLTRAAQWLKPGGALVYAVCSLEPEEGEDRVSGFLQRHPEFEIAAPIDGELPAEVPVSGPGSVRILPGLLEAEGGLDGFFMARLVRRG